MPYEVRATARFLKEFSKLDGEVQKRIKKKAGELSENPEAGVPLTAGLKGKWKLRVGDYRIVYVIDHEKLTVFLLAVGPRKNIYDRLE